MKVIEKVAEMQEWALERKRRGRRLGFVPTMGYLHAGHLTILCWAREDRDKEFDRLVVGVFIDPFQFSSAEEYRGYPRDIRWDKEVALGAGADVFFVPSAEELYPEGFATLISVGGLEHVTEVKRHPERMRGALTTTAKLLNIVQPDCLYLGLKNAYQVVAIRRMIRDLNFPVKVKVHPVVRDEDGLAVSARNFLLSEEEREAAKVLYRSLQAAEQAIQKGEREVAALQELMINTIKEEPLARFDYVEILQWPTLQPVERLKAGRYILTVSAYFGPTHLTDHSLVEVEVE
ncbi:pantoate--beta-alanine ligase [Ammonifex thiophilus]|uniref:Pantothenate synthetase n=1 Tax=Ammonifex thiophilus TaxID=444093 RepID=A0A3D8P6N4_9THEO|nr:pantoate--beta-alanine ligase [Ammonifex thiophilus]RDV84014.1 pantoate--beta-alanine ligase [Ammonifex thiophilus]